MARIVRGAVADTSGAKVPGLRIRAWDEDSPDGDDQMGAAFTDGNGVYSISYHGGDWDTAVPGLTTWRPDIYVTVERPNGAGGFTRVARSRTYSNHRMSKDLTIDFTVPTVQPPIRKVLNFDPAKHGFHFLNSFDLSPRLLDLSLGSYHMGFCGGMSAGACSRWASGQPIPQDTDPPQQGTPLFAELLSRQIRSLAPPTLPRIIEWQNSPDQPHWWTPHSLAWRTRQEWPKLAGRIDAGKPTVLVLMRTEGATADPTHNHQVLAFGYEWQPTTHDLTVLVYDPNHRGQTVQLTMTLSGRNLRARQSTGERLRGFFVNDHSDDAAR